MSIGMFEHVGDKFFASFFQFVESCVSTFPPASPGCPHSTLRDKVRICCPRLLKPGGTAVIHTITSADSEYPIYKLKGGFMQEYIFPGVQTARFIWWREDEAHACPSQAAASRRCRRSSQAWRSLGSSCSTLTTSASITPSRCVRVSDISLYMSLWASR